MSEQKVKWSIWSCDDGTVSFDWWTKWPVFLGCMVLATLVVVCKSSWAEQQSLSNSLREPVDCVRDVCCLEKVRAAFSGTEENGVCMYGARNTAQRPIPVGIKVLSVSIWCLKKIKFFLSCREKRTPLCDPGWLGYLSLSSSAPTPQSSSSL